VQTFALLIVSDSCEEEVIVIDEGPVVIAEYPADDLIVTNPF